MGHPICQCGSCKRCRGRENARVWRERHPEKHRESQQRHREKHPDAAHAATMKWRSNNPEIYQGQKTRFRERHPEIVRAWARKHAASYRARKPETERAHRRLRSAVDKGEIVKHPCSICGNTLVDAHHPDYSKPLEVVWLCRTHHNEVHGTVRGGG